MLGGPGFALGFSSSLAPATFKPCITWRRRRRGSDCSAWTLSRSPGWREQPRAVGQWNPLAGSNGDEFQQPVIAALPDDVLAIRSPFQVWRVSVRDDLAVACSIQTDHAYRT